MIKRKYVTLQLVFKKGPLATVLLKLEDELILITLRSFFVLSAPLRLKNKRKGRKGMHRKGSQKN
jgi:hypothetical protein